MKKPIRAILAVDQAEVSGTATGMLTHHTQLARVAVGVVDTAALRAQVVQTALAYCDGDPSALAVCFEDHGGFRFSRGNMSVRSSQGMGAARGRWLEALELAGVRMHQIYRVAPEQWRGDVLGLSRNADGKRAKAAAVTWANAVLKQTDVQTDAAEALAILHWAARNLPIQIEVIRQQAAIKRANQRKGAA